MSSIIEKARGLIRRYEAGHGVIEQELRYAQALVKAVEALEEIANSTKWSEDTAIKREIRHLQDVAAGALRELEK